jgi:hypothetical protein
MNEFEKNKSEELIYFGFEDNLEILYKKDNKSDFIELFGLKENNDNWIV